MHLNRVGICALALAFCPISCASFYVPSATPGSSLIQTSADTGKKNRASASAEDNAFLNECEYRIRVCDLHPSGLNSDLELSSLISKLKTAVKREPEDIVYTENVYKLLGLAYWLKGNQYGARQTLQSLDNLSGYGKLSTVEDPAPALRSRFILDKKKRLRFLQSSSEPMLWSSVDAIPADLLLELALAYLESGDIKEARTVFNQALPRLDQRNQDLYEPYVKRATAD